MKPYAEQEFFKQEGFTYKRGGLTLKGKLAAANLLLQQCTVLRPCDIKLINLIHELTIRSDESSVCMSSWDFLKGKIAKYDFTKKQYKDGRRSLFRSIQSLIDTKIVLASEKNGKYRWYQLNFDALTLGILDTK